ncbi:plasmid replication protein RepC [Ensifer soli]|uniref:plasmid replication protein RepC n=1 Tax=Ciceribacter sp. sgz301302 TaxID=3342379 RepID=UPI0035B8CAB4
MIERIATTPFGGGRMTARLFRRQNETAERQRGLADGANDGAVADKWQLLRALTEARRVFGLGDRTITLLEALVSFTTGRGLDGREAIIVFPSNRELSMRARGMAPATLRRHLAALVEAGLIFRRDSANGKRYCRRDEAGAVEDAFGFDLAPLALKAAEIMAAADAERARARAERALRAAVTLHRRDIAKIIAAALEEERSGDWPGLSVRFAALNHAPGPRAGINSVQERCDDLARLRADVEYAYLSSLSHEEMSANDHHGERHIQNSKTQQAIESSGREIEKGKAVAWAPERKMALSLSRVVRLCPSIVDYAREGVASWNDLIAAADLVRAMLGVSPDAWAKAKAALGTAAAAVVVAAMLERAETIRSPGGYLRRLTEKASRSAFSIYPMLDALERRR